MNLGTAIGYLELDTSKFQSGLKTAQSQFNGFTDSTNKIDDRFKSLGNSLKTVGSTLTKNVTLPLTALGTVATKSAVDFESAFAGVRKTVDATDKELEKIEKGIKSMAKEMPTAATEIAGVAEAAGQLGIQTDNILGFTKTMVMLGDSTNMSADEAATSLARLANITGMSQKDFDKLGSTIVALGNNLATTESEITAMGLRLAGAGAQVGMSEAQILSFAGALSSVGIEAEAGGSAFSKVMIDMQLATEKGGDRLKQFADVAGMTSKEFKKAFQEDASTAIMAFIEGLGTCEERGMSAIGVLDDMEIREVRLRDALLRAAGASDVFNDALKIGTDAWSQNTALTKEAEQRYETLASKMAIMKNKLTDVGITIGTALMPYLEKLVTKIGEMADWFGNLDPSIQSVVLAISVFLAAIGPAILILGNLFTAIGSIITGFGLLKTGIIAFSTLMKTNLLASIISFNTTLHASVIPALTNFASVLSGTITSAITTVSSFITGTIVPAFTSFAGILKGAILGAIKGVATFLTGTLIPALTATAVTIGAVAVPVWAVIAVFAALVAAGVLVYKNWDTIKAKCIEIWEGSIKPVITNVVNAIKSVVTSVWNSIKSTISSVSNSIKSVISTAWNAIKSTISSILNSIKSIVSTSWNAIKNTISSVSNSIKSVISTIWNAIKSVISNALNGIKSVVSSVWNAIKSTISSALNSIKSAVSSAWNNIKSTTSSTLNGIKSVASSAFNGVVSSISSSLSKAYSTAVGWWNKIKSIFSKPISAVVNIFKKERSLTTPPANDTTTYANSLKARENTINDFAKGISARTYTMYKDTEVDLKLPTVKVEKDNNSNSERPIEINLNIDKFVNERKQDVRELMQEITFEIKRQRLSLGGAR